MSRSAPEGPSPGDRVREVGRRLRAEQGPFRPKPRLPVIDELVATVLSQHTSDRNSERAFASLKERFPSWEAALDAPPPALAEAIRSGGIADQKAVRIQRILATIVAREGRLDLGRLSGMDDGEVDSYLITLPGVGPKTAACVLLFAMGRAAFPVDTHVHRVTTRLGWVPAGTDAARAHRLLAGAVPADIRYDLHVALVTHGRTVCVARRPRCQACVLLDLCAFGLAAEARSSLRCPGPDALNPPPLAGGGGPKGRRGVALSGSPARQGRPPGPPPPNDAPT